METGVEYLDLKVYGIRVGGGCLIEGTFLCSVSLTKQAEAEVWANMLEFCKLLHKKPPIISDIQKWLFNRSRDIAP